MTKRKDGLELTIGAGGQRILHHPKGMCGGEFCCFHNPSLHLMVEMPMYLRADLGFPLIERICKHHTGHPDPDSLAWLESIGIKGYETHGCCGCCVAPPVSRFGEDST